MNNNFEKYYIFDKWYKFLENFEIKESIFISNIGFENRSLSSIKLMEKYQPQSLKEIKFLMFYLKTQSRLKTELEQLGIDFELSPIDKKKGDNIKFIENLKSEKSLDLNLFPYCLEDDNGQIIGFVEIFSKIKAELEKREYKNVYLDISSFPRSIFIPLIKILFEYSKVLNLLIIWTNKGGLTFEKNVLNYDQPITLPRFKQFDPDIDDMIFWLPILSYDPKTINIILNQRRFTKNTSYYPLLTFPTMWPEETNNILIRNKEFFLKKNFESDKVLNIPYNNPFEFFLRINDFYKSKEIVYGKKFYIILSPFGTKAQSLGTCLSALLLNRVSLLICRPIEYIDDIIPSPFMGKENTYLAWIKGDI